MGVKEHLGRALARFLAQPSGRETRVTTSKPGQLAAVLRKGDVLLVEGSSRFSTAVKYLTQSTWSHAALCIADPRVDAGDDELLEADVVAGVRTLPLRSYWDLHTRICRPVGLRSDEIDALVAFARSQIGRQYDLRHIVDLARYLIHTPPVPSRWRRGLLALGSGDPTRAICSSLIAEAFQSVHYPILPSVVVLESGGLASSYTYRELLHIQHHSLFAPRDFDISPYFQVVKPTLELGFSPHDVEWTPEYARGGP